MLVILDDENLANLKGCIYIFSMSLMFFIYASMIAIVLNYTTNLHGMLKRYIEQSANLLDGMHEGIVIISKVTNRTLFCNRPA